MLNLLRQDFVFLTFYDAINIGNVLAPLVTFTFRKIINA